jgi:hypothetical protein
MRILTLECWGVINNSTKIKKRITPKTALDIILSSNQGMHAVSSVRAYKQHSRGCEVTVVVKIYLSSSLPKSALILFPSLSAKSAGTSTSFPSSRP